MLDKLLAEVMVDPLIVLPVGVVFLLPPPILDVDLPSELVAINITWHCNNQWALQPFKYRLKINHPC